MDIKKVLLQLVINFFIKKSLGSGIKNENMSDQKLTEELHKQIIRLLKKRKVHSSIIDSIWGADRAEIQLINKVNEEIDFLLCIYDIFSKYTWVISWKEKKGITITSGFQKILDQPNGKTNKIWVKKGSDFYNRSYKSCRGKTNIEMCSTNN